MKAMLKMRPSRNTSNHTAVVIDTMKYICRNSLLAKFPSEVKAGFDVFDTALVCHHASLKAMDTSMEKFVEMHRDCMCLIMDGPKLDRVTKAISTGVYEDITDDASDLVNSSMLGQRLFSHAWDMCSADAMYTFTQKTLRQLNTKPLTLDAVAAIKKKALDEAPIQFKH